MDDSPEGLLGVCGCRAYSGTAGLRGRDGGAYGGPAGRLSAPEDRQRAQQRHSRQPVPGTHIPPAPSPMLPLLCLSGSEYFGCSECSWTFDVGSQSTFVSTCITIVEVQQRQLQEFPVGRGSKACLRRGYGGTVAAGTGAEAAGNAEDAAVGSEPPGRALRLPQAGPRSKLALHLSPLAAGCIPHPIPAAGKLTQTPQVAGAHYLQDTQQGYC